ncbi:MAG: hypothetical protein KDI44_09155 [Thiothrix sp.]|nr:hypothetical protein [Thiothrix sp.]
MSETQYRRVVITGLLTLESNLHIGTGGAIVYEGRKNPETGKPEQHEANTIVLDKDGAPYIPGSSLRGLLASLTPAGAEACRRWFGDPRGNDDDHGAMGALRIHDAPLEGEAATDFMSRTAIEPVTGTARQHQLATHVRVGAGAKFRVEIGFDTRPESFEEGAGETALISEADIGALLAVLQSLNGEQLGTGKSVGQGVLGWELGKVSGLSDAGFQSWLLAALDADCPVRLEDRNHWSDLSHLPGTVPETTKAGWIVEDFKLTALSPILINDPQRAEQQRKVDEAQGSKPSPDLMFMQNGNEAIIPGSTLKGWFRARCRKIMLTLNQGEREATVDRMLNQLFGSKDSASLIRFRDATVTVSKDDEHLQTFNAVDRFTGGVKEGALYTVQALRLPPDRFFKSKVMYRPEKIEGWMQLLLLFAWKDAEQGDLVLGWGKARGYGRLRLASDKGGSKAWIEKCRDRLAAWEQDLLAELAKEVK